MQVMLDPSIHAHLIDNYVLKIGVVPFDKIVETGILPGNTSICRADLNHIRIMSNILTHPKIVERFKLEQYRRSQECKDIETARKLVAASALK